MSKIIFRTAHLHGTGDEALKREHVEARKALQTALEAVKAITVHGRDYREPEERIESATQYHSHIKALTNAFNFIQAHELVHRGFDEETVQGLAEDLYQLI